MQEENLAVRPEGHLVAVLPTRLAGDELVQDLAKLGLGLDRVTVYQGAEDGEQLESSQPRGIVGAISRIISGPVMPDEDVAAYERAVQAGRPVVAAYVPDKDERERVVDLYRVHGAEHVQYYGGSEVTPYDDRGPSG